MPAARNKNDLTSVTQKEFAKLSALISEISHETAMIKEEDTSIKDVIAHRAHWITLFLGWYSDGQAGREVHMPAKGYKWNQLPEYNARLRSDQCELGWADACASLGVAHKALLALIDALSDEVLYAEPMQGGNGKWTTGRFAEAAGASHYRSAAKYIKTRIRAAGA